MNSLEEELETARALDVAELADAVESFGFECTRCGACCKGYVEDGDVEPHTATVFPDEVRRLRAASAERPGDAADIERPDGDEGRPDGDEAPPDGDAERPADDGPSASGRGVREWRDVARPMPYGLREGADGPEGETFEWALQVDACGDCAFYEESTDGTGACAVHAERPLICRTYPFSVSLGGTSQPMGDPVDEAGVVRAHECEGLGRDISRADALALARTLKERAVRELEEAIAVREAYEPASTEPGDVVVHDSEGAKRPDGSRL